MGFATEFQPLSHSAVLEDAKQRKEQGWRYVQMLAVNNDATVDVVYSYMKDGLLDNLVVEGLAKDAHLPSITDVYLEAFVCENEIHDLFGITFDGLAIDFLGNFYRVSTEFPMTITSPEKIAEQEKQRKAAEKKAAASATDKNASATPEEDLEAKLAGMDPEKAAKVRAAMQAKAKKAQQEGGN